MAYQNSGNTVIDDSRNFTFSNVTIQNNGFLEITSSDGFQGTVAGYTSGGGFFPGVQQNIIDKFPFATDTNATDVGDLTEAKYGSAGQSSSTHGYASGGFVSGAAQRSKIEKFPFSSDSNATDVGNLIAPNGPGPTGQSSTIHGYSSGGYGVGNVILNTIQKFLFAVETTVTDVGDLTIPSRNNSGQTSAIHGYTSGGFTLPPSPAVNTIDKFPFATDTNATDVGDLIQSRRNLSGQSSTTHGYASGGSIPSNPIVEVNTIEKFPFSSDTNATDVGDLSGVRERPVGQSSIASGYTSGGVSSSPPVTPTNTIDKFPFSSDTNATDVGDLTFSRVQPAGQQD